ncbi:VOC family protein [Butyrivibrio sp. AC2005]|uniref:VOC family protein n=1 Tax=Butyrivibrio sp. AC2005 TaxID=1280672 RepID=UPI001FA78003|nr:VOC family protein [Butyrivibrio sp. AC2005]
MLAVDQAGNKLLEFIDVSEERASLDYSPITVCLLVVKIGADYLPDNEISKFNRSLSKTSTKERTKMVKGIHHISMKCNIGEIDRVKDFYINVLGMSICREWPEGIMIDSGNGLIEVFVTGNGEHRKGSIRHIAFATEDVDNVIDKVKKAGYEVFIEPNDKVINSSPEYQFRMAFCFGPLGEEIEFFDEK